MPEDELRQVSNTDSARGRNVNTDGGRGLRFSLRLPFKAAKPISLPVPMERE